MSNKRSFAQRGGNRSNRDNRGSGSNRNGKRTPKFEKAEAGIHPSEIETLEFSSLDLKPEILKAVAEKGYTHATPIQSASLPSLLEGKDFLGQAQTGTGKTAAFALPILNRITSERHVQCLVLAPTRELAGQVAEALEDYSKHLKQVNIVSLYGGTGYHEQLRGLRKNPQIVVGTPGRVMDHLRQKTLIIDELETLVLDEADEMLRMGFIDDVEWILDHAPEGRQTVLFSATMPPKVKRVADTYLTNPEHIHIEAETQTSENICQRYINVKAGLKLDALWRVLEAEDYEGVMIFAKTKAGTHDVAEYLNNRGLKAEALNGDLPQDTRERLVDRLKNGQLDIIAATDVAARGLDVKRITHVINYDLPHDIESYVHRIGRTGRAGRQGDSISFVTARQKRFLEDLQAETGAILEKMPLPNLESINARREGRLEDKIKATIELAHLDDYRGLTDKIIHDLEIDSRELAAALIKITCGEKDLWLKAEELEDHASASRDSRRDRDDDRRGGRERGGRDRGERGGRERGGRERGGRDRGERGERRERRPREDKQIETRAAALKEHPEVEMQRFKLDVGYQQNVKPGQIVGAIANEAELDSAYIGHIEISETFSTVDLPAGMPKEIMKHLRKTVVNGKKLEIDVFN